MSDRTKSVPAIHDRADASARTPLLERFRHVRARTEALAAPLSAEDQCLQSMPSCSPTKWHRAHTTWFFETFLLAPRGVDPFDARWGALFNSYYEAVGPRHPRPHRGILSRPSSAEIADYRRVVDARVVELLAGVDAAALEAMRATVELGLAHEEQHQELLLTDVLHALYQNPLRPSYRGDAAPPRSAAPAASPLRFRPFEGGVAAIGATPDAPFHFDNEAPRHRVFLEPFEIASRLVTVAEWKAFVAERGYETPSLWLSDGYDWVRGHGVRAPLYAEHEGGALVVFGLDGLREARDDEPIANVSYYEADAIARFFDARLPTEPEWEIAAPSLAYGEAWEWTSSPYGAYPGFRAPAGAIGEYNGKFMVNQMVLRGGSSFTPRGHVRASYRNFWPPDTRHQRTGVRLARSAGPA